MDIWYKIEKKEFSSLYLLYGTESYIINETEQKLVANVLTNEEIDFNLSVYDLEETPIEQALEDAETFPIFGENKLVILHNPFFLTAEKGKEKVEHDLKKLEAYLINPAPYSILVFSGHYEKLDERKKITKLLKKNAEVIEGKKLNENELVTWIKKQMNEKNIEIEEQAVHLIIELVGSDLMMLHSEIQKLALYVEDGRQVTVDIVKKLVSRSLEQNIFDLIDHVVKRNMNDVFRIYYDLRKQNEEPIKILALIASQFRLIYQVKELRKRGYGEQQTASVLKVHPYRVKLASRQAQHFSEEELMSIMNHIANTDLQLKTGSGGREVSLELLLLKLGQLPGN